MNTVPSSFAVFRAVGVVLWLIVTAVSLAVVLESPGDHVELALFLALIWIVLIALGAFSYLTEHRSRPPG